MNNIQVTKKSIIICGLMLFALGIGLFISFNNEKIRKEVKDDYIKEEIKDDKPKTDKSKYDEFYGEFIKLESYDDYLDYEDEIDAVLTSDDFRENSYIIVRYDFDDCSESISNTFYEVDGNELNIFYETKSRCGVCAPYEKEDLIKIKKNELKDNINLLYQVVSREHCDMNIAYKPMIYLYPNKDMDLTVKLGNSDKLTSSYPKYNDEWNIHVSSDGNIYDYGSKRNYYGLYWEAYDDTKLDYNEGFVVSGTETVKFLEEKLEYIGLNEYEINEFITYWISKLENNNYNYFRFRTKEEIDTYMPLYFSETPDSIIRVLIDFKALDNYIEVKEQKLDSFSRNGFTVVEWGMTSHYE